MRCCFIRESEWKPAEAQGRYMGAPAIWKGEPREPDVDWWLRNADGDPSEPIETFEDGCPGSWVRCEWFWSVMPYVRPRSGDGVYSENLRLSRCDDPLVLEAVHYYETERNRWSQWFQDNARPQPAARE
jgi:hypothetical protein